MVKNYASAIFKVELGVLPATTSTQRTRIMSLVDLGTSTTLPVGDSTIVGDKEELATVVPITSDTYKGGVVYFENTRPNSIQNNTLTVLNVGVPTATGGTASILTGGTLGTLSAFQGVTNGSFSFELFK